MDVQEFSEKYLGGQRKTIGALAIVALILIISITSVGAVSLGHVTTVTSLSQLKPDTNLMTQFMGADPSNMPRLDRPLQITDQIYVLSRANSGTLLASLEKGSFRSNIDLLYLASTFPAKNGETFLPTVMILVIDIDKTAMLLPDLKNQRGADAEAGLLQEITKTKFITVDKDVLVK